MRCSFAWDCRKHTLDSPDTLVRCVPPMSLVPLNRGEAEDMLEMILPLFGSWWPSWSVCYMTLTSLFFQGFRQASSLYRSPGSAIAHGQSLSNASMLGISSEHDYVLCKCNVQGMNTREGECGGGSSEHFKYHPQEEYFKLQIFLKAILNCISLSLGVYWLERKYKCRWEMHKTRRTQILEVGVTSCSELSD